MNISGNGETDFAIFFEERADVIESRKEFEEWIRNKEPLIEEITINKFCGIDEDEKKP